MTTAIRLSIPLLLALSACGSAVAQNDDAGVGLADGSTQDAEPASLCPSSLAPSATLVITDKGAVQGSTANNILSFKGVPYANAPLGELRWAPPEEEDCWERTIVADSFASKCAQAHVISGQFSGSEDCLFLNLWKPEQASAELRPVVVFLHGGANLVGNGNMDLSDFAKRGNLIAITLNYRLGPFGFLAHPAFAAENIHGSTGNYGIQDQLEALRWIQRNIEAFGGDPTRVTLSGQSAGAHDTSIALVSPLAKDLFSKAVIISHSWAVQKTARVENTARLAQTFLGCNDAADVAACLRSKSALEVAGVPGNGLSNAEPCADPNAAGCGYNLAYVDGYVLPELPAEIVRRGNHNAMPVMVTSTAHEWVTIVSINNEQINTDQDYRALLEREFSPSEVNSLLALYPSSDYATPYEAYVILMGDVRHHCTARYVLDTLRSGQSEALWQSVWAYSLGQKVAKHGSDLKFMLYRNTASLSTAERTIAQAMADAFARFAAEGSPSSIEWPAYGISNNYRIWEVSTFTEPGALQSGWRHEQCDSLEAAGFTWDTL